jgi:hypothetical protein
MVETSMNGGYAWRKDTSVRDSFSPDMEPSLHPDMPGKIPLKRKFQDLPAEVPNKRQHVRTEAPQEERHVLKPNIPLGLPPRRSSGRVGKRPARLIEDVLSVVQLVLGIEIEGHPVDDTISMAQALAGPLGSYWKEAQDRELVAHSINGT